MLQCRGRESRISERRWAVLLGPAIAASSVAVFHSQRSMLQRSLSWYTFLFIQEEPKEYELLPNRLS
uniref:Uncharacterized protein n=1 Tax=Physcomitrium patens TaxID=3218 RepID=A0A2K1LAA5_PHYPA|nr:hypothetical protein PHYPA_001382 [Physcomitrium patens]